MDNKIKNVFKNVGSWIAENWKIGLLAFAVGAAPVMAENLSQKVNSGDNMHFLSGQVYEANDGTLPNLASVKARKNYGPWYTLSTVYGNSYIASLTPIEPITQNDTINTRIEKDIDTLTYDFNTRIPGKFGNLQNWPGYLNNPNDSDRVFCPVFTVIDTSGVPGPMTITADLNGETLVKQIEGDTVLYHENFQKFNQLLGNNDQFSIRIEKGNGLTTTNNSINRNMGDNHYYGTLYFPGFIVGSEEQTAVIPKLEKKPATYFVTGTKKGNFYTVAGQAVNGIREAGIFFDKDGDKYIKLK